MKTFIASIFLFLQLVSFSGFLVVQYFIQTAENSVEQKVEDKTFSKRDLIEIKIPLHLPYSTNGEFEPIKGHVERNGSWYNYVSRKVYQDTLILLCIQNTERTRLETVAIKENASHEEVVFHSSQKIPLINRVKLADEYPTSQFIYLFLCHENSGRLTFVNENLGLPEGHFTLSKAPPKYISKYLHA